MLAAHTIFSFVSVTVKIITMNYLKELNTVNASIDLQRCLALYIQQWRWIFIFNQSNFCSIL